MNKFSDDYNLIGMMGVLSAVCAALAIRPELVLSKSRNWDILEARQLSLYFIYRAMPHLSQSEIGRVFGIGHSTVGHAISKIDDMLTIGDIVICEKHQKCISLFKNPNK